MAKLKIPLFIMLLLSLPFSSIFAADERITITTYYPSPTGVYKILRLFPRSEPASCQSGEMIYNDGTVGPDAVGYYGCNATGSWKIFGGSGGTDPYWDTSSWDAITINSTKSGNVIIGQRNAFPDGGKLDIRAITGNILTWCGAECGSASVYSGIINNSMIYKPAGGSYLAISNAAGPYYWVFIGASGATSLGAGKHGYGYFDVVTRRGNPPLADVQIGDTDLPTAMIWWNNNYSVYGYNTSMQMMLAGSAGSSQAQTLWTGTWRGENIGTAEKDGSLYHVVKNNPSPYYQIGVVNKAAGAFTSADMKPILHVTGSARAGGSVGIGTTNPASFKLQVAGNVGPEETNKYNLGNLTAPLSWNNIYYSGTLTTPPSDARLKTNITDTSLGLDFIMRLRPVQFNWKNRNDGAHQGIIAQELEKTIKNKNIEFAGLSRDAQSGRYAISYTEFVGPLIKAIQEQDKEIEILQSQIDELNQKDNL
jgi:hypothetical protein